MILRWAFRDDDNGDEAERIMLDCMFDNRRDAERERNVGLREGRKYGLLMRVKLEVTEEEEDL